MTLESTARYAQLGTLALLREDWADWRGGNSRRIWARRGYLCPIEGRAPLIWIRAGRDRDEIRLAADLMGAIRSRRYDLRLILTYEFEDPDVLRERLDGLERERIAFGYGPGGRKRWLQRAVDRLQPRGLITVGHPAEAALQGAMEAISGETFACRVAAPEEGEQADRVQPLTTASAAAWEGRAVEVAPAVDPMVILALAQVEPVLPAMLGRDDLAWFIHVHDWDELAASWAAHPLSQSGVLFVTPAPDAEPAPADWLRIGQWQREPLPAGTIVVVDDPRWHGVLSVSAQAIHLLDGNSPAFWQAMAGHRPVTVGEPRAEDALGRAPCPERPATAAAGLEAWQGWREDPAAARNIGAACRQYFWTARRMAQDNLDRLLERIEAW